ncbi:MAG: lysylphosphatidylglycerol synthase transmembrane domain-containing protein [Thermodesulfobacteriota bacterium]
MADSATIFKRMNTINAGSTEKSRIHYWIRQMISAGLLLAAGFIYSKHIELNAVNNLLKGADPGLLVIGYLIAVIVVLLRVLRWRSLLKDFFITTKGTSLFLMYLVDIFLNNFISGLSIAVRGLYLKEEFKNSGQMVRLLLLDKLFDWVIPLGLGFISLLFVLSKASPSDIWKIWGVFLVVLPCAVWQLLVWLQHGFRNSFEGGRFAALGGKIRLLVSADPGKYNCRIFVRMSIFSIAAFSAYYITLFLLAKCFSLPIRPVELIMVDTMATIAVVVPLNFAGIGTRDVALTGLLAYYGCPHENIVLFIASLILLRLAISLLGWFSMYILKWKGYSIKIKKQP